MPLAEANVTDHADSASEGIFEFLIFCERVFITSTPLNGAEFLC